MIAPAPPENPGHQEAQGCWPEPERAARASLSGHQSAAMRSEEWLTPPEILGPLGTFHLDPCAPAVRPWDTALRHISLPANGLAEDWEGRVWLNPPFGSKAAKWLRKLADHGNGIALIPARTETRMFYESVWQRADAVCFLKSRPHFCRPDGTPAPFNSGAPICLVAYGRANVGWLQASGLGVVVRWSKSSLIDSVAGRRRIELDQLGLED